MKKLLEAFKWINLGLLIVNICPFLTTYNGLQWKISQRKAHYWAIFFINAIATGVEGAAGLFGYLLVEEIMQKWNVQTALVFISLTIPIMIGQVNILVIFAQGEEHATVFRMLAKFEDRLSDILNITVDFTLWQRKLYFEFFMAFIYWIMIFYLKGHYYTYDSIWIFIYHILLGLIDLNFLLIVCHIRSTVRCLRIFQKQLLLTSKNLSHYRDFRALNILTRELMEIKRYVDKSFGPLLLVNIAYDFVALVFQFYFYYHFLDFRYSDVYKFLPQFAQIFKIIGFSYKAVAFVIEMEAFYKEVKELKDNLRKGSTIIPHGYFYQILHEKHWEYFTASKFFDLNYYMVNNFFAGCVTYIVIMLQLDLLDYST
uniref:Gustatory receptor n=1 Tax=Lutzomyia longipalpis TaxID=7200 RepID=A0A3F2ZD74_LUTLO